MSYNVNEFKEKIGEEIEKLGVSSTFKESPAYSNMLAKIEGFINLQVRGEYRDDVNVFLNDGEISIDFKRDSMEHSISISCPDENTIQCKSSTKRFSETPNQKSTNDLTIKIDPNNHNIDCYYDNALACDNSKQGGIDLYKTNTHYYYVPEGILARIEEKSGEMHFEEWNCKSFDEASMRWNYKQFDEIRTLDRAYLDVARYIIQRKNSGNNFDVVFSSLLPLNLRNGLIDMEVNAYGIETDPNIEEQLEILPKSQEETEEMINKYKNPKVQEVLRNLARNRDKLHYIPSEDKYYVNKFNELKDNIKM